VTVNPLVLKGSLMLSRCFLVILAVGCSRVSPEDAAIQKAAKAKAELVQSALVKGDLETVADYTHPKIIEQLGGREQMIAVAKQGLDAIKAKGIDLTGVKILDPSRPVKVGNHIYIYVPMEMEMKGPGQRLLQRGGVVGFSSDGGKTWVFVDIAPGRTALKKLIPDIPDALDIPAIGKPKVIED
jgi:hypothetical protein